MTGRSSPGLSGGSEWALPAMALLIWALAAKISLATALGVGFTAAVALLGGIPVAKLLLQDDADRLAVAIVGAAIGLVLLRLFVVLTSLVLGTGVPAIVFASALVGVVGVFGYRRRRGAAPVAHDESTRLLLLISALFLFLALPYWGFERPTPQGHALIPYFDNDFLNHVAITAEVARHVPPENPYFSGERLHYYWLYHLWPAASERLAGGTAVEATMLTTVLTAALFVALTWLLLRAYVEDLAARTLAVAMALFAYSYIGWLALARELAPDLATRLLPGYFTRDYSLLSHSWFRDALYEPHALAALTGIVLGAYLLFDVPEPRTRFARSAMAGLALGVAVGSDAFVAGTGLLWLGSLAVLRWIRGAISFAAIFPAGVVIGALGVGLCALGMFPFGEPIVHFGPHPAVKVAPALLLVDLGPVLLMGLIGAGLVMASRRRGADQVFLLALTLVVGFALVTYRNENLLVRKSIKLLQLPLVVLSAIAFAEMLRSRAWWRPAVWFVVGMGTVTLASDIAQHLRVGPDTTFLSDAKLGALRWVRLNTDRDAVFQDVAEVRPNRSYFDTYATLLAALGERRTSFGNYHLPWEFRIPSKERDERIRTWERLFAAGDYPAFREVLVQEKPTYLWVDDQEPGPRAAIRSALARGMLKEVYREGPVAILAVALPAHAAADEAEATLPPTGSDR